VDWNNDGKKDLITGERQGQVRLFINSGSNASPVFTSFTYIKVAGSTFDCGYNSMPVVTDWNEDGKKDLLIGEHDGKIFLLLNVNTDADPVFQTTSFIQNGSSVLDIGGRTSPDVVDWDKDGNKDIIAGETDGNIFFIRNVGTNSAPAFNGFTLMKAGGQTIDLGYNSRAFLVDWDNDGVKDIFAGCTDKGTGKGLVWYFHSLGAFSTDGNQLSVSTGGSFNFALDAGPGNMNRKYLVLACVTGAAPGFPLPGGQVSMPLNWDVFTDLVLAFLNTSLFNNYMGKLDSNGLGSAQFNAPPTSQAAVGLVLFHAYCLSNPFNFVSNPIQIEFTP